MVRSSDDTDSLLVPLIGSLALVMISTAAVAAWLIAIVMSGLVVMILYRTRPAASSHLVIGVLTDSFRRIGDASSHLTLLAVARASG